jgi:GWxTD domain-containing protein
MGPTRRHGGIAVVLAILFSCSTLSKSLEQPAGAGEKKSRVLKVDGDPPTYKTWLQQDVIWIITEEERAAFKLLQNDEERDNFIEAFWARRNPTPDSFDNPYKDEHYRRIVYANSHYGTRIPGWKNDRGRMYIMYGPPDEIESYPTIVQDNTPGVDPSSYPLEVWHYQYLDGIGEDVVLEFVDACKCGEYSMPTTPAREKDVRSYSAKGLESLLRGRLAPSTLQPSVGIANAPRIKFKSLEEKLNARPTWKTLPFEVSTDSVRATDLTSLVPITITFRNHDITFVGKDGSRPAELNVFGRLTTLTGRVAEVFEATLKVGASIGPDSVSGAATTTFVKTLALRNGRYRIEIAAQQGNGDRWGTWTRGVKVGGQ